MHLREKPIKPGLKQWRPFLDPYLGRSRVLQAHLRRTVALTHFDVCGIVGFIFYFKKPKKLKILRVPNPSFFKCGIPGWWRVGEWRIQHVILVALQFLTLRFNDHNLLINLIVKEILWQVPAPQAT